MSCSVQSAKRSLCLQSRLSQPGIQLSVAAATTRAVSEHSRHLPNADLIIFHSLLLLLVLGIGM